MIYFKKVCKYDNVIVELNADKYKYLNYETSSCGNTSLIVCIHCHDGERLNFFKVSQNFSSYEG